MDNVVLLSELHPLGLSLFNPLKQASDWFGLLRAKDVAGMKAAGQVTYSDAIALIAERCAEKGSTLVLRDWAHLDYTGYPFLAEPSYRPLLYEELSERFEIVRIATTRNPVTQWQSLVQLDIMREPIRSGAFGIGKYLAGYRKYAELCLQTGFVRYEDLLDNPEDAMRALCENLGVVFDPEFVNKWHAYVTITGDINNPRCSKAIKMPPSRPLPPALRDSFLAHEDYRRVCDMLGYRTIDG
jgi:protein O-GlcNAc transferase